jgi:hypothetical protein
MKTLKSLSFIVCLILCSLTYKSFSQDVITLSNGTEIEAKVIKITDSEIEYKKWNNQEGPSYVEKISNVSSIKYQNGNKDTFNQKTAEVKVVNEKKKSKPFIGINGGIGAGINYEKGFYTYTDSYNYEYYEYYDDYYAYLPVSVGVDFAFPIGSVFALGPYASLGSEVSSFNVGLGALAMFRFKNECAIMVGEGLNIITDYGLGNSYRLGFKFKKRLYLLGEVNTSSFIYNDQHLHIEQYNVSFLIHVGFKLN